MHSGSSASFSLRTCLWMVALAVLLPSLTACGQKGDLYLPPQAEETQAGQDAQLTLIDQASNNS